MKLALMAPVMAATACGRAGGRGQRVVPEARQKNAVAVGADVRLREEVAGEVVSEAFRRPARDVGGGEPAEPVVPEARKKKSAEALGQARVGVGAREEAAERIVFSIRTVTAQPFLEGYLLNLLIQPAGPTGSPCNIPLNCAGD